ncbi:salicylate hydroxylase [Trichoderma arundinaceum]|uniref:Salicylate hydroxylase n=1 Tax=Trichoderma arundinaceum TaxID=490622 RepID=A0A395P109_TRIAR|nr:salicylate hydroxylase [Trichoderma arundinaceum]
MGPKPLNVGVVGAGIGGLSAAIAIARAGATVTLLEAAEELGEIGAGIQMLPNVSRFLVRWGVDKIIGDNLVSHEECNTYHGPNATLVAHSLASDLAAKSGFPWWVVRRDHLHYGLTESARRHGVKVIVGARVSEMQDSPDGVRLQTTRGDRYSFDMVVGADGIRSFIRSQLFPGVVPKAPSKIAAYRGVLSYKQIFKEIPEARAHLKNSMDVWAGPNGYILTYPISGGKELNIVTAFCKDDYVTKMEQVDIEEFRDYYKDYSPIIQKILKLVNYTQRWPLLQTPRMESWSNKHKNVVLLGDAVHCMQNNMAQGAATAMEDGAFLGRILSEVVRETITIPEAIQLYEKQRIPKAWVKQQISYVSGLVNMTSDSTERDKASLPESQAALDNPCRPKPPPPTYRSWQYYCSGDSVPGIFYYDAEGDADAAVCEYLCSKGSIDEFQMLSENLHNKWIGYIHNNGVNSQNGEAKPEKGPALTAKDYERFKGGL